MLVRSVSRVLRRRVIGGALQNRQFSGDCQSDTTVLATTRGLLDGVQVETASLWSESMDLDRACELMGERDYLYKAALQDVGGKESAVKPYLESINAKAGAFIYSDEVWNRGPVRAELHAIAEQQGLFVCMLGGKSTGKSLLLSDLAKRYPGQMFVVDLRVHRSVLKGLLSVLQDSLPIERLKAFLPRFPGVFLATLMPFVPDLLKAIMEERMWSRLASRGDGSATPVSGLSLTLETMVKSLKSPVTIVIDEANIAYNDATSASRDETKAALQLFTTFTKQKRKLNVILVSSEHAFPFGLGAPGIDFKLSELSRLLFVGEVPPRDMLELLRTKWGVRDHLAIALLAYFGGHVHATYLAVRTLAIDPTLPVGLNPNLTSCVQRCLAVSKASEPMLSALTALACTGFVPLHIRDDPVAKIIAETDVGGVVSWGTGGVGVSDRSWGRYVKYGLVPFSQSMRLAIAEELVVGREWGGLGQPR